MIVVQCKLVAVTMTMAMAIVVMVLALPAMMMMLVLSIMMVTTASNNGSDDNVRSNGGLYGMAMLVKFLRNDSFFLEMNLGFGCLKIPNSNFYGILN